MNTPDNKLSDGENANIQLRKFWQDPNVEAKLSIYDVESSLAHVEMLGATNIVDAAVSEKLVAALHQIKEELAQGKTYLSPHCQDIHSGLEARLHELVGDLAMTLRVAKSSNDQIATDIRLWLRDAVLDLFDELLTLRSNLLLLAERDLEIVMPGYTHMQPAMPILLSHWWLANEARFRRDFSRLSDFFVRFNVLPLGAGALAGTNQPIDRRLVAERLRFDDVIENSLYAVSDRDYLVEFASFASLVGLHISQLGSDLLLWTTQEFGFARLRKAFVFRSQSMPQKRNPVVLEVLRSRPSHIFGRLVEFIVALKAIPMGYCQDLQDSLPGLFDLVENLRFTLELARVVLPAVDFDAAKMKEMASADLTNAACAMDFLIAGGMAPDKAARVVEQLVNYCKQRNKYLADLELNEWQQFSPAFDKEIYKHVTVEESVGSLQSYGGTALEQVVGALAKARDTFQADRESLPELAKERMNIRQLQNI